MDAGVQIRTIEPADKPAVMELHRFHYWRSHCLLLNADFYRWQFELPPGNAALGGEQSLVAVDSDGRLLSFLGVVASQCSYRGAKRQGAHLITWLTAPEARGRGVGHRMMEAMTERYDFLFGRSVTPAALTIYRRLGFRYFPNCSRWIIVLDADATAALAMDTTDADRVRARWVSKCGAPKYFVGPTAPEGAASLAAEALADSLTLDRTAAYFQWRYERHPRLCYEFLWTGESQSPEGVAVVRLDEVAGRPGRVLRIVEFLAQPAHAAALGACVCAHGKAQGCAFADMFGMSERFATGLVAAGGFNTIEEPDLRLPHLFQPWTPEVETPGLLFFGRPQADGIRCIDDITSIHVSRGDGNMDWPSWHPATAGAFAPAVSSGQPALDPLAA